jgi:hypothetical protein
MNRVILILDFLNEVLQKNQYEKMYEALCEHFEKRTFLGLTRNRLVLLEAAMATICAHSTEFSYDKLAKASGDPDLVSNSNQFRRYPKLQGNPRQPRFQAATLALWKRLEKLPSNWLTNERDAILKKFLSRSLDGMNKQPRAGEGALDVLLKETITSFARRTKATLVVAKDFQGEISAFSSFIGSSASGVNVEVPYVLTLKDGRRIIIHRVMADGGVGHKRKEFASKIRTIRYESTKNGFARREDIFATVIVLDGNWVTPDLEDKLTPFRMLTVAGWDYVVYPDQLSAAFAQIEAKLSGLPVAVKTAFPARKKIGLGSIEDLPMAAEAPKSPKLKRKGGHG